jgi:ribosomal protein RSM22 (predicted rRNA methylase)
VLSVLPKELAAGIAEELSATEPKELLHRARRLSERYREHEARGRRRFIEDKLDALAYAALILPAAHAQLTGCLSMLPLRVGEWQPKSLLDLGAGPGTAAWAALEVWPDIETVTFCEGDPEMISLGRALASRSPSASLRKAKWREGDLLEKRLPSGPHDLVIISLVLSELEPRERAMLVAKANAVCSGVVLVIEPGTPATFEVLRHAREQLVSSGRNIVAPCPHDDECPLVDDWCHFSERHERPSFQRKAKEASLPWEDTKFSFVAASSFPAEARPWARVRRHPWKAKGRVGMELCAAGGLVSATVAKSKKDAHRLAKKLDWGSAVETPESLGLDEA